MGVKGLKKCRTGLGLCEVSEAAKSCIHCRYNKCLSIGMTSELLQGKRKREEEPEPEQEMVTEEKILSEPRGEKMWVEPGKSTGATAEQTNTEDNVETGQMIWEWNTSESEILRQQSSISMRAGRSV